MVFRLPRLNFSGRIRPKFKTIRKWKFSTFSADFAGDNRCASDYFSAFTKIRR